MKGPGREGGREGCRGWTCLVLGGCRGAGGVECLQHERTLSSNNSLIQQSYTPLPEHGQHKKFHQNKLGLKK